MHIQRQTIHENQTVYLTRNRRAEALKSTYSLCKHHVFALQKKWTPYSIEEPLFWPRIMLILKMANTSRNLLGRKLKKYKKKCIRLAAYTHFLPCPDARPKGWRGWSPRLSPTSGEVLPGHFLHFAIENGHREFVDLPSYKIFKNCESLPEGSWFDIHVTSCNPLDIGLHQRFGLSHIGRNQATAISQALADHLWNSLETWLFPDHWGWYMSFWGDFEHHLKKYIEITADPLFCYQRSVRSLTRAGSPPTMFDKDHQNVDDWLIDWLMDW